MTGLVGLLQPLRDSESGHTRDTALGTGKSDKEGRKGDRDRKTHILYVRMVYVSATRIHIEGRKEKSFICSIHGTSFVPIPMFHGGQYC